MDARYDRAHAADLAMIRSGLRLIELGYNIELQPAQFVSVKGGPGKPTVVTGLDDDAAEPPRPDRKKPAGLVKFFADLWDVLRGCDPWNTRFRQWQRRLRGLPPC